MNKITTIIGLSFAIFLIGLATTLTRSMMIGFLIIPFTFDGCSYHNDDLRSFL